MANRQLTKFAQPDELKRFADAIHRSRAELLQEWRDQVRRIPATQKMDSPTLNDQIPALLEELASALVAGQTESVLDLEMKHSPKVHGVERYRAGFDIVEVVAEYNVLREVLHDLAVREGIATVPDLIKILNRIIDSAVALAVDTYAKERSLDMQKQREEHLSFVMHDLRTPISAMQTAGQILDSCLPSDVKTQRIKNMFALMRRNSDRVNALLKMAIHEQHNIAVGTIAELKAEPREFDLWPLVEEFINDFRPLSEDKPITLVNAVSTDLVVFADAVLINQVVQNLLSNALKYTKTGQIVIGAEYVDSAGSVRCWVTDTGIGIPADRLKKVFEKFETDPKKKGGQGLGLAIVKRIVEEHGGEVGVDSSDGQGARFWFILPGKPSK